MIAAEKRVWPLSTEKIVWTNERNLQTEETVKRWESQVTRARQNGTMTNAHRNSDRETKSVTNEGRTSWRI